MKPIVLYSTRSGNTEKVPKAIATELNCPCIRITKAFDSSSLNLSEYDLVFAGTGIYRGQPHADLLSYLQEINRISRKQFALFMTCFGWGKDIADKNVVDKIKVALETKGQKLLSNRFCCFGGGLGFVKRGHPDAQELDAARKWAKEIILSERT